MILELIGAIVVAIIIVVGIVQLVKHERRKSK